MKRAKPEKPSDEKPSEFILVGVYPPGGVKLVPRESCEEPKSQGAISAGNGYLKGCN